MPDRAGANSAGRAVSATRRDAGLISPAHCRMARAGLGLSVRELARLSGVSGLTVTRFESGNTACPDEVVQALRRVLEDMGAEFATEAGGVVGVRVRA